MNRPSTPFRWLIPVALACGGLGACVDDTGTAPTPPKGLVATDEATWALTHGGLSAAPNDSCVSTTHWSEENARLQCTSFMDGSWQGRTFTGSWNEHVLGWEDYVTSGSLEATVSENDSLLTAFMVEQHIVWNLSPDVHRHETATVVYNGPGLVLGEEDWGYIFRNFGEVCCDHLSVHWSTWLEEDSGCTYTAETIECLDVSSLHVGFYPRD
ncbi:MAG: hypothetical protein GY838_01545 [bacterium]|nr:hypothetical protein [bacterium]